MRGSMEWRRASRRGGGTELRAEVLGGREEVSGGGNSTVSGLAGGI